MVRAAESPAVPLARTRPAWWRRGVPQTQTAYVGVAFAALVVVIWILAPVFMTPRNLLNISKNFSFIALMSLGETLVIISGGIDLSVGSVCALSAVVTMMLMRFLSATAAAQLPGATIALAALLALVLAALIGLVNGLLIARVRLSPFVTTLGMLSVARGMAYVLTQGRAQYPVGPDAAAFTRFANGAVLGLPHSSSISSCSPSSWRWRCAILFGAGISMPLAAMRKRRPWPVCAFRASSFRSMY